MSQGITREWTSEQEAWAAVSSRDRSWDGQLYYGVRTTGIFCRPSCPSKRPKRENAEFFSTAEAAETAGYRACYRCHPRSIRGTPTEWRIRRAAEYLENHFTDDVTLDDLGQAVGLSPFHLQRKFTEAIGLSPHEYQQALRLTSMKDHLRTGAEVGRAVWRAGYGSMRGAYASAAAGLGMTPAEYRAGANGKVIRYSTQESRFGWILVAWTSDGVCAVLLGDSPEEVKQELDAEFSSADFSEAPAVAEYWIQMLLQHLEGKDPGFVLPLDLHGSNFQLRVWKALQEIPPGEVRTFKEIARAIGRPNSARAVGRACATNKVALAIPCHRVVRSDGSLAGYRWGTERKRRLLKLEQDSRKLEE